MEVVSMRKTILAAVVLAASACVVEPMLVPDKTAQKVGGTRNAATAEALGIRVFVDGADWQAKPVRLTEVITPVRVTVENHGSRPVRIAYADFSLDGKKHYPALPIIVPKNTPVTLLPFRPTVMSVEYQAAPAPKDPQAARRSPRFDSKLFTPRAY